VSQTAIRAVFLATVLGMAAYCATHVELSTNITNFMPERSEAEQAVLASRLADSQLTRTMILTIGASDTGQAVAAARELAERIAGHPEVAWVRAGLDPGQIENVYRLYFPRRDRFFSDHPEQEIPALLEPEALRERARALRLELALPTATLTKRIAASDPLGAFERVIRRFRDQAPSLASEQGQFVTTDGRYAVIFLATRHSAFDSRPQQQLLGELRGGFAEIARRRGGDLVLETSGANRFAVAAEQSMRRDVALISAVSFVGVSLLFFSFLRSLHFFLLAIFPPLTGILAAATLTRLVFGRLDGLTMAFGAALIGVAIDYSIFVINHHRLDPEAPASEVVRRVRPSLVLGALTTIASFAGLVFTSFPGFREIGVFSMAGVGASLLVTLTVLPGFLGPRRHADRVPPLARRTARRLGDGVRFLAARRRLLLGAALACAAGSALVLPRLRFVDDLSRLMAMDPGLRAEDDRVRARVAGPEQGRVVIALGEDADAAIAKNDAVAERLAQAQRRGVVSGYRSLHALLWSRDLQDRNLRAFAAVPDLADRVETAFSEEGFRREALAPFRDQQRAPAPPALDAEALRASPLGELLSPLLLELGDRFAVVTYLRGVSSPDALAEALEGLEHVHVFDQHSFLNEIYREFRVTTLEQMAVGTGLVLLVLGLRYRRWRPMLAALLPSLLVLAALLGIFAATGVETNLLHVMSLNLVMGMGVDYGIFMVDSARSRKGFDASMLSMLICCLTTVFGFGTLAISAHPALRAIGVTTGVGILLSLVLAPVALLLLPGVLTDRDP
jgi:predicted exporter